MNNPNHIPCNCGCGLFGASSHMCEVRRQWQAEVDGTQMRRAGRAVFTVLKLHRADFENELGMMHAVEQVTRANIGRSWLRRLCVCPQLFDLQMSIFHRTQPGAARAIAWQTVRRMLTPRWGWLQKRLLRSADVSSK